MLEPPAPPEGRDSFRIRHPAIARGCFHLDWIFVLAWAVYLCGPDALALSGWERRGPAYRLFAGSFFALHFILIATGIIALFVVIIEIHARRPVRGLTGILVALALPTASFLYFSVRFLEEVRRWLAR